MNKPGYRSTEFWISAVGMIGGLVLSVVPETPWAQMIGGLLSACCGMSYTMGRSWAKGKTEAAHQNAKTIADTLLKKSS
jgi:hypothetical protein|tara:strand:- start:314 stop:550 length:237 start_codon:yes stop_codon:yes gene_type:complete